MSRKGGAAEPLSDGAVDAERYFLCPSLTPLWYAPVYDQLEEADRRVYNQLTALMGIEAIGSFEATFLPALASARRRLPQDGPGRDLSEAIDRFEADERGHIVWWERLHGDSLDALGLPRETRLLRIQPTGRRLMREMAHRSWRVSAVFWLMLALEEHALEIARRNLKPVSGHVDTAHVAAHRDHLRDEARHVQLDWHLIERFYAHQPSAARWMNARFFEFVLERYLLPPVRGALQVIDRWVRLRPRLRPQAGVFRAQLRAVALDPAYREMMYSRRATPVLFSLFDRYPEMAGLARRLDRIPDEKPSAGAVS